MWKNENVSTPQNLKYGLCGRNPHLIYFLNAFQGAGLIVKLDWEVVGSLGFSGWISTLLFSSNGIFSFIDGHPDAVFCFFGIDFASWKLLRFLNESSKLEIFIGHPNRCMEWRLFKAEFTLVCNGVSPNAALFIPIILHTTTVACMPKLSRVFSFEYSDACRARVSTKISSSVNTGKAATASSGLNAIGFDSFVN